MNGNIEPVASAASVVFEAEKATPEPPKKRRIMRKSKTASAPIAAESGMIELSPAQVSTLWQAVTGGTLEIKTVPSGGFLIKVSLNSFNKALPVLLDYMAGQNGVSQ